MALISKARFNQKEKVKIEISSEILEQIRAYCQWSQIDNIDFFMEEAASYVFAKDKEWKAFQKTAKKTIKAKKADKPEKATKNHA